MDVMTSPWRSAKDSPSRQLLWELGQMHISDRQLFTDQLDREAEKRALLHRQALQAASTEHDRVRENAEHLMAKLQAQLLAEKRRQEEEIQKDKERQRKEELEQDAAVERKKSERQVQAAMHAEKVRKEARRQEDEIKSKEQAEKARNDAEVAKRLQKEQEERAQADLAARAAVSRLTEVKAKAEAPPNLPQPAIVSEAASMPVSSQTNGRHPEWEAEHLRYLDIHHRLKEMRNWISNQVKGNPQLKTIVGDKRRDIKKYIGQVREGKAENRKQLERILEILKDSVTRTTLTIDILPFLASPPTQSSDSQIPALLLYLLNIFAKAIINQLIDEAGVKPQLADPVGIVATHIFAVPDFRWNNISLVDILIAKFHKTCPVLFGVYGDEHSVRGKQRLGWLRESEGGPFISQQRHLERMTGLGAGYAALSLRNYEKARNKNPYPDCHYWQALARLTNVPPNEISQTHFVVLKGMIQGYEAKFIHFFGDAAIAVLRYALIEVPKRSPPSVAAKALAGVVDVLKRDQKLIL